MFADKKKMTAQDKIFVEEINFYTDMKSGNKKKKEKFSKILEQCDAEFMFAKLLKKVQKEDDQKEMPVRRFFDNTFKQRLNSAIFQLNKAQSKEPEREELFRVEGMVKVVAFYLLEDLPEGELVGGDGPLDDSSNS